MRHLFFQYRNMRSDPPDYWRRSFCGAVSISGDGEIRGDEAVVLNADIAPERFDGCPICAGEAERERRAFAGVEMSSPALVCLLFDLRTRGYRLPLRVEVGGETAAALRRDDGSIEVSCSRSASTSTA